MDKQEEEKSYEDYTFNRRLFRRLWIILKIFFPSVNHLNSYLLIAVLLASVCNEFNNYFLGLVPSDFFQVIISNDDSGIVRMLIQSVVLLTIDALMDGLICNLKGCLQTAWRQILCNKVQQRYFSKKLYYRLNDTDRVLDNPDQRITQDIDKMVRALIDVLIGAVMCPGILIFYSYKSYKICGVIAVAGSYIYMLVSALVNTKLIAPIVKSTTELERWEGDFRFIHTKVRINAEAIAFQSSEQIHWNQINKKLNILCRVYQSVFNKASIASVSIEFFNNLQDVSSYLILGIAFIGGYFGQTSDSDLSALIAANHFYIYYLTSTFGDVISQYDKISQTAGTVHRVGELLEEMEILAIAYGEKEHKAENNYRDDEYPGLYRYNLNNTDKMGQNFERIDLKINDNPTICVFKNVSVTAPGITDVTCANTYILSNFSYEFKLNENVLLIGPGSCGKTTVLRLMKGLWSPSTGKIIKSNIFDLGISAVYFQPVTVSLCAGTLKQLLVFPKVSYYEDFDSSENYVIQRYMVMFGLQHILDSFGGLTSRKSWQWEDILSSNETKLIALIRILYHRSLFTAIDNIFNNLKLDTIKTFYNECARLGMTVVSIGEKALLQEFHDEIIDLSLGRFGED